MPRNKLIGRQYMTEAKVEQLLAEIRQDSELGLDKWEITISRESKMIAVEGPNKGSSEVGHIVTLRSLTRTDVIKIIWATEQPSNVFTKGD